MNSTPRLTFRIESNYFTNGCQQFGATAYREFPVRVSIPAAAGRFSPKDRLGIRDKRGTTVPGVVRPLHLWPDGSVRVWEVWMPAALKREETRTFELAAMQSRPGDLPHRILREPSTFIISATWGKGSKGRQKVVFSPPNVEAGPSAPADECDFEIRDRNGKAVFKGTLIRQTWSWYPGMDLAVRVINYAPGEELMVKALTLEFDLPGKGGSRYTIRHATMAGGVQPRLYESSQPFLVRADHGGIRVTDIRQLGRRQTDYADYERGHYAEAVAPWIAVRDDESGWVLSVPDALERMPKGWTIRGRRATVELHPKWAEPLPWLRGMALYQRVHLEQVSPDVSPEECENRAFCWLRPPLVTVDAEAYRSGGWRIPFRYDLARFPRTELTIRDTWGFSWAAGTFDWGDMVGANKGSLPLPRGMPPTQGVARNHEYDFVACAAKEFARTGRQEVWKQCRAAAEHLMHTDFVAVSDNPWKEGGVPHHCNRHTRGAAYPSHMWIEGLTLYYQLSGDPYALKVARRVGDFFLKYVNERFFVVGATSREMGWALVSLSAVYDLTQEKRYLQGIRTIVDHYLDAGVEKYFPGDATFAMGVGMIGMDRARPFHRTAEVKAFILGVLDRMMATRVDAAGVFDYHFDAERTTMNYVQTHLPEALNAAWKLSGDLKYLKAAWRLYQIHQSGIPLTVQNKYQTDCGYAAGYHITWTMGCLASFAERGWLDKHQFPDPE